MLYYILSKQFHLRKSEVKSSLLSNGVTMLCCLWQRCGGRVGKERTRFCCQGRGPPGKQKQNCQADNNKNSECGKQSTAGLVELGEKAGPAMLC